jgi:hypothetical protein
MPTYLGRLLPALLALILSGVTALAGRPVYTVREYPEVSITSINAKTKGVSV